MKNNNLSNCCVFLWVNRCFKAFYWSKSGISLFYLWTTFTLCVSNLKCADSEWGEYAPLYENEQKERENSIVETTAVASNFIILLPSLRWKVTFGNKYAVHTVCSWVLTEVHYYTQIGFWCLFYWLYRFFELFNLLGLLSVSLLWPLPWNQKPVCYQCVGWIMDQ